jgi:hypothetical protein
MSVATLMFCALVLAPLVLLVVDLVGHRSEGDRTPPAAGSRRL